MATVTEVLTAANDSVDLINSINADSYDVEGMTQTEINEMVQRNIDHLEIILEYTPENEDDETPDVAGSSEDKTAYIDAISTGKAYISANN